MPSFANACKVVSIQVPSEFFSISKTVPGPQRERKKLEARFAELKNQIGLRRLRLRRLKFVREQFFLAAAAQTLSVTFSTLTGGVTFELDSSPVYLCRASLVWVRVNASASCGMLVINGRINQPNPGGMPRVRETASSCM
jgi:hypothetical protein